MHYQNLFVFFVKEKKKTERKEKKTLAHHEIVVRFSIE